MLTINSDIEDKKNLEVLIKGLAKEFNFEIYSLNMLTKKRPILIEIILKKSDGGDITIEDCLNFNEPVNNLIENSKLLNFRYVLEISSQGISDELTSNRDFKTFKGFPVKVELNQNNSKKNFLNGLLYEKTKDYLAINIKGKIKKIPFIEVLKVSLATIED